MGLHHAERGVEAPPEVRAGGAPGEALPEGGEGRGVPAQAELGIAEAVGSLMEEDKEQAGRRHVSALLLLWWWLVCLPACLPPARCVGS